MKAFTLDGFDAAPGLRELDEPSVGDGELLVRVHASSVNPVDAWIAGGALKDSAEHEFPVVLGRDFSGVVERTGAAVTRYADGDEVFGYLLHANPTVHDGSWAELIAVPEDNSVAAKPRSFGHEEAGAAPLAAITALAGFDALAVQHDENVLVVGATGGVGSFFVQLAADSGAHVIAPALEEDREYLTDLGVAEVVDRGRDLVETVLALLPDGVDAMFDATYAPETSVLAEGGRLASPTGGAGEGKGRFNVMSVPSPENLTRLAELLDAGVLRVPIRRSYAIAQAGEALADLHAKHTQGKLGLTIA